MALTGLAMVGFLVAHLAGNLLIFAGPQALTEYALGLRKIEPLLWVMRSGLILSILVHIFAGVRLTRLNQAAKPQGYAVKKRVKSNFASSYMLVTGFLIVTFILYHLAHLTFKVTHPEFANLGPFDLYAMMVISFKSPIVSFFYVLSIVALMMHLNHGVSSLFQSLGINHGNINCFLRFVGPFLSIVLAIGFLSIPLAVFLGFIG